MKRKKIMNSNFRTILVISYEGEDPDEIAKMYSDEYKVNPHLSDISEKEIIDTYINYIDLIHNSMSKNSDINNYDEIIRDVTHMTPHEFYKSKYNNYAELTDDGHVITYDNPNAHYQYPKCYQKRLEITEEEATFSNPFHLKDGGLAYSAHLNDIDWDREHGYKRDFYESVWEVCVDGREPKNKEEKTVADRMSNRNEYFNNFNGKEEYAIFSTSFWMYGYATSDSYLDASMTDEYKTDGGKEWASTFYDKVIKSLKGNPLLSIYEVKMLY